MRKILLTSLVLWSCKAPPPAPVEAKIPPRAQGSMPASQLLSLLEEKSQSEREKKICEEIGLGNVPSSLRRLVKLRYYGNTSSGQRKKVTLWVMPDYLSVGSDGDSLRVPLTPMAAQKIADGFEMQLPTRKIVNLIYRSAKVKLPATPIPPREGAVHAFQNILRHNESIEAQMNPKFRGRLIAGHKKDIVLSKRLDQNPDRVAIYGWHKDMNHPIQPLSLVHDNSYLDYSHGIRLLSKQVMIDKETLSMDEVLKNPELAPLLSDEGPLDERYPSLP